MIDWRVVLEVGIGGMFRYQIVESWGFKRSRDKA